MNKKTTLTWMTLVIMLAVSGCGNGGPPSAPPEQPAAQLPSGEELKEVLAFTLPSTTAPADWTVPIRVAPHKAIQKYPYKLPADWPQGITPFEVGMVEIGSGASTPGRFVVAIDIDTVDETVSGLLASTTDANVYLVKFERIAQKVNSERGKDAKIKAFQDLPEPPNIGVAIGADKLCFVVKTEKDPPYFRYCSEPGSMLSIKDNFKSQYESVQKSITQDAVKSLKDSKTFVGDIPLQSDQIISEMENPKRLEHCGEQIINPAKAIQPPEPTSTPEGMTFEFGTPANAAVPGTPKPSLEFSQGNTLGSENTAALQAACGSDITVAAVTLDYFKQNYQNLPTPTSSRPFMFSFLGPFFAQSDPTPITVAVVQILQPIDTSLGTVFPGNYRLDFWFQPDGAFYAATITGTLEGGTPVNNQPVPAVPATFVNEDSSEQSGVQISAARMFGRCTFFQSTCS